VASLDKLLNAVVDSLILYLVVDAEGRIRRISRAYAEILGMSVDNIINKPVAQIIPTTGLLRVIESGEEELGQFFVLKNGETTLCNRLPIRDKNNKIIGAMSMAIVRDNVQLSRLNAEIKRMRNVLFQQELSQTNGAFSSAAVVGDSPAIKKIKATIEKIAASKLCVLLTGETGAGKEVFANMTHFLSRRRSGSFVKVNCAAIPDELLESELFGYVEGAFSGASKNGKMGKFEMADGGTIMLDEIGDLPLRLQTKLLRVLQENELQKVGSERVKTVDVRVICCTNRNLEDMVRTGAFRRDLYYRISTVELAIPPLREHREDIPLLCTHLIKKINQYYECYIEGISGAMLRHFDNYAWPGNVRELEHVLERACVITVSGVLDEDAFDFFLPRVYPGAEVKSAQFPALTNTIDVVAKEMILQALQSTGGNKSRAAGMLNISRSQFYVKLKKYGISG
jgi:PAS domain S-box-containing protein